MSEIRDTYGYYFTGQVVSDVTNEELRKSEHQQVVQLLETISGSLNHHLAISEGLRLAREAKLRGGPDKPVMNLADRCGELEAENKELLVRLARQQLQIEKLEKKR